MYCTVRGFRGIDRFVHVLRERRYFFRRRIDRPALAIECEKNIAPTISLLFTHTTLCDSDPQPLKWRGCLGVNNVGHAVFVFDCLTAKSADVIMYGRILNKSKKGEKRRQGRGGSR